MIEAKNFWLAFAPCVVFILPHNETRIMFGEFVRQIRERRRLGLREFCLEHGHDSSNWSKVERGVLPPPRDEEILRTWAE